MIIRWLGHASFEIHTDGRIIYIDPYLLPLAPLPADLILITHDHYDHCDSEEVAKIKKKDTVILTTDRCSGKLSHAIKVVRVGDVFTFGEIEVKVVPAYNINKQHHIKGHGVGYVIEAEGKRVYHAGDTDFIPEMSLIEDIRVALLPIDEKYAMDIDGMRKAVQMINPEILIPMHHGHLTHTKVDLNELKFRIESTTHTRVEIMRKYGELFI